MSSRRDDGVVLPRSVHACLPMPARSAGDPCDTPVGQGLRAAGRAHGDSVLGTGVVSTH